MCLSRCCLLMTVFCFSEIRAGVTRDLMSVGFLPFSFFFPEKMLDSLWFSVLVHSSHFPSQSLLKPYLPHSYYYFLFLFHSWPSPVKKASFPVMSPVSSTTTNTRILTVDFIFSLAVSLKSWGVTLSPVEWVMVASV